MDFLKIRKKAKEKAAAREAPESEARAEPGEEAAAPEPPPSAPPPPAATDADILEGELAARLQGLPSAEDARFMTWRPGAGAPPQAARPPPPPPPEPRQEDFAVVSRLGTGLTSLAPVPPPVPRAERPRPPADPLDEFFYREDEEAPEVPAVGAPPGRDLAEDAEPGIREEYLTFVLGDEEYAVAIERVREVMRSPPITEVPHAPPHVLGVVTVRGEVVAVFDPRRRLGLPGTAPPAGSGRVVIVDAGDGPCGLLVDRVSSVVRLRPGSIEPRPQGIGGASADCLAGIGRQGERLFTVLDLGAFLRRTAGGPRRGGDGGRRAGA
ncbi:MAG TPA: chemotaxis protein CheW [Anaeromyxobacter sp.]